MVFPQDYDAIHPWKLGILTNTIEQMPDFDPGLLRWALTNPHPPDLDNQPAGTVAPVERAEAAQLLVASTQRGQDTVTRVRVHREREEQRRPQRECEQHHRETKKLSKKSSLIFKENVLQSRLKSGLIGQKPAGIRLHGHIDQRVSFYTGSKVARKAEYKRRQQEIAARKAALLAQGIVPESRSERKRRLAREAAARSPSRHRAEVPAVFERRSPLSSPQVAATFHRRRCD